VILLADKDVDRAVRILSDLDEGKEASFDDLEFLADLNDTGLVGDILGAAPSRTGSSVMDQVLGSQGLLDGLSEEGFNTLQNSLMSQGSKALPIMIDLGLDNEGWIFSGGGTGKGTAKVLSGKIAGEDVIAHEVTRGKSFLGNTPQTRSLFGKIVLGNPNRNLAGRLLGRGAAAGILAQILATKNASDQAKHSATGGGSSAPDQGLTTTTQAPILVDPATGEVLSLDQVAPGATASQSVQQSYGQGSFSPETLALAQAYGIDPNMISSSDSGPNMFNPLMLGEATVNPTDFPAGVNAQGAAISGRAPTATMPGVSPVEEFTRKRAATRDPSSPDRIAGLLPDEDAQARAAYGIAAPPGAKLNPRFFQPVSQTPDRQVSVSTGVPAHNKQEMAGTRTGTVTGTTETLSSLAAASARKYGVPIDILYGVINATSGWDTTAVGNNGTA
jgi:hypothetical protein